MEIAVCKITTKAWNEHLELCQKRGWGDVPMRIFYGGTPYEFNPECELSVHIAKGLQAKRSHIVEILEVKSVHKKERSVIMNDEKDEHDLKYGEVYLCKHCGWPYSTPQGRDMHENRWCKRKGE